MPYISFSPNATKAHFDVLLLICTTSTYKKYKKIINGNIAKNLLDIVPNWSDYDSEFKLRVVRIYFYATTFDKITKDRAAKFVDQLSAIGGTMGLLTGFSIISGVEILYFLLRFIYGTLMTILKKRNK